MWITSIILSKRSIILSKNTAEDVLRKVFHYVVRLLYINRPTIESPCYIVGSGVQIEFESFETIKSLHEDALLRCVRSIHMMYMTHNQERRKMMSTIYQRRYKT